MAFQWGDLTRDKISRDNYPDEGGYQDALRRFDDKEREVRQAESQSHVLYEGTENRETAQAARERIYGKAGDGSNSQIKASGKDFAKPGAWDAEAAKSRLNDALDKNSPNARNMGDPDVNKRLSALGVAQKRLIQSDMAAEAYKKATSK